MRNSYSFNQEEGWRWLVYTPIPLLVVVGITVTYLQEKRVYSLSEYFIPFFLSALVLFILMHYAINLKNISINGLQLQNKTLLVETVTSFAKLIEDRDMLTGRHSERVRDIVLIIGRRIKLTSAEIEDLSAAAVLHDIGKIGIPETILNKPGKLTASEYQEIKKHPLIGYEAVKNIPEFKKIAQCIIMHHEAFDGSGYPCGKAMNDIPFIARVLSIADVFEALTANRAYRKAMTINQAREIMLAGRGTKFDPEILDTFIELLDAGKIHIDNTSH